MVEVIVHKQVSCRIMNERRLSSLIFYKSKSRIKSSLANKQTRKKKVFIVIFIANFMKSLIRE